MPKQSRKRAVPKTKAAKKAKMGKVMHEFKGGKLKSGSKDGPKVMKRPQAIAIGLKESGQSKPSKPSKQAARKKKLDRVTF